MGGEVHCHGHSFAMSGDTASVCQRRRGTDRRCDATLASVAQSILYARTGRV